MTTQSDFREVGEDFLAHHGIKGMKWGVRKEADRSSSSIKSVSLQSAINTVNKMEPPLGTKSGITPEQKKKLMYGIAGGIAVVAILGGAYYLHKHSGNDLPKPGSLIKPDLFRDLISTSRIASFEDGTHITPSSFKRPEFTIKAGTVFHRFSTTAETTFGNRTFASASIEDFNRYASSLGQNIHPEQFKHVKFSAKSDLKVPSLDTTIETLREVLSSKSPTTTDEAFSRYKMLMAHAFVGDEGTSKKLFDALSKKGFHALLDDSDAGIIAEKPLILFDSNKLSSKSSEPLTSEFVKKASNSLTEISNRKL